MFIPNKKNKKPSCAENVQVFVSKNKIKYIFIFQLLFNDCVLYMFYEGRKSNVQYKINFKSGIQWK